jgi:UDP:flavonoid glycosyltransferase YjiC (YdhE family)
MNRTSTDWGTAAEPFAAIRRFPWSSSHSRTAKEADVKRLTVVLSARPSFGHVYPMMPLANALRTAGHRVIFATGAGFVPRLRALGFETYAVGISIAAAMTEARRRLGSTAPGPDWEVGFTGFIEIAGDATASDLLPLLYFTRPDLVVYEQTDFGAAIAAASEGIPAVVHSVSRKLPAEIEALAGGMLSALWGKFGFDEAPLDVFVGDAYLGIFPPSLEDPSFVDHPAWIPLRPIPWSEPASPLPDSISGPGPLAYVTLGTVASAPHIVAHAINGLVDEGARVIVALGATDEVPLADIPDGVTIMPFVHQADLLPSIDLAIHHGGSGTMLGALSWGIPSIIVPLDADQPINAAVAAQRGVAIEMDPSDVTRESVRANVRSLLRNDRYRSAAHDVAMEIEKMAHPGEVVADLIALTL